MKGVRDFSFWTGFVLTVFYYFGLLFVPSMNNAKLSEQGMMLGQLAFLFLIALVANYFHQSDATGKTTGKK